LLITKLLVVETSPRGDHSVSRGLTRRFVAAWGAVHPEGEVINRDLMETDLKFIGAPWLQAYFTPPEQHSPDMQAELRLSDELVAELLACNHLVIATPVYNYNVPAALKAWIDSIVRKGLTLGFDGAGLVQGKKATVLMASGGVYTEGSPIRDRDIAAQYLHLILKVIGITDVTVIAAGNAKSVDMGEIGREEFLDKFQSEIEAEATRRSNDQIGAPAQLPTSSSAPFADSSLLPKTRPSVGRDRCASQDGGSAAGSMRTLLDALRRTGRVRSHAAMSAAWRSAGSMSWGSGRRV
jgi:FMN-dependent NADH-azoreductase